MSRKLTVVLAVLALVAVPTTSAAAKPDHGDRPAASTSKSKSAAKRCQKASVAKGFVVSGVVSAPEVATSSDRRFTGSFTLTVEKANKVARQAGWSVADAETVDLDDVRLSVEEPADATLEEGESVKLVGKVSVPRKNKKFDCGATVGAPTFKKIVFKAPTIEVEPEGPTA